MTTGRLAIVAGAVLSLLGGSASARSARAQSAPRLQAEGRADVILSRASTVQGGAGVIVPAGTYARIALVAGAGATRLPEGATRGSARADLLVRFLLDPLAQSRWAPYVGGGLGYLDEGARRRRGVLLLAVGLEGPRSRHGLRTAIEAGLGGGARLGLVVRQGRAEMR